MNDTKPSWILLWSVTSRMAGGMAGFPNPPRSGWAAWLIAYFLAGVSFNGLLGQKKPTYQLISGGGC
jgi:hypothetical protein